jgi:threonine/homoserine/homoserine lactone efflux protein
MLGLLPLFGIWFLAVISPGPDFLVTVRSATGRSRRHGILTGLGVSTAILVWATASMLGLSVLLLRISWIYDVIRMMGAAYLVYLGIRTLWDGWRERTAAKPVGSAGGSAGAAGNHCRERSRGGRSASAWRMAIVFTNIGNPKAAVFFEPAGAVAGG